MKTQTVARRDPEPPVAALSRKRMARGDIAARPPELPPAERTEPSRGSADLAAMLSDTPSAAERPLDDLVAERAYFIYLARDGREGDALGDWLEAERQIALEQGKA